MDKGAYDVVWILNDKLRSDIKKRIGDWFFFKDNGNWASWLRVKCRND